MAKKKKAAKKKAAGAKKKSKKSAKKKAEALGRFTHRALLERRSARYDEKEPRGLLATRGALTVFRPPKNREFSGNYEEVNHG